MFKPRTFTSLILVPIVAMLSLLALSTLTLAQGQNNVVELSLPSFFTTPAIDESEMDYYLAEGVALDRILSFAWSKAETGYYKGAEFYYGLASERFPNSYEAQATFATFYYQIGKIPESIRQFQVARDAAASEQDKRAANYFIERIARQSRVGKEAVDTYYLGVDAFASGDFVSAAGWLEQSLQATPDWIEAQYWLGRSYFELGQDYEAIVNLEKVVAALPATDERAIGAAWLLRAFE